MSTTGLPQFDETVHLTNVWLKELMEELDWPDRHRAYRALRATLHVLRDRLPAASVAHLGAQLPMLVRGFYYEGWRPEADFAGARTRSEFVDRVESAFANDPNPNPDRVVSAVLRLLARHVSAGEMNDIKCNLPEDVRSLWRTEPWLDKI